MNCLIATEITNIINNLPPDTHTLCNNKKCRHNVYWEELFVKRHKGKNNWKVNKNSHSVQPITQPFRNCMRLFETELTLADIGKVYGISRQCVEQVLSKTIIRLRQQMDV